MDYLKSRNIIEYNKFSSIVREVNKLPKNELFNIFKYIPKEVFNSQERVIKLLNDIRKDKPYFLPIIDRNDFNKVICVKPKSNNPRISRQQGAFLIFGIDNKKSDMAKINESWQQKIYGEPIIIDKDSKTKILKELLSFGISEQFLFPELDNQATHIMNRYKASN